MEDKSAASEPEARSHFVQNIVATDVQAGSAVMTRFPPEPNGYLHIGHAKSILLNFAIAVENGGVCNLRFDDTNPSKEEQEYVNSIQEDMRWLGCDWGDRLYFASDYFEALYDFAMELIDAGKAYVCDLDAEQTREYRGTVTKPGKDSPNRSRTPKENRDLFTRMRAGEFEDGARTLRAKIDTASPNMNMRDPVMYRIMRATHHRTGNDWCIYPMYDWAHGQCDAIEGVTHSICTLEFENHRPLYDWFLDNISAPCHPQQIEFARLNLTYTVMSKRKLLQLVEGGLVEGWDDPRMPTISGLRRRGYTAASIRGLCSEVGVAKFNSTVDYVKLENEIRGELNVTAPRRMVVTKPLKLVIENYPEGQDEEIDAVNNPGDESAGTRKVPFSRELWIEADDFREEAPRKYFRLKPGQEVRLRYAYYVTCTGFTKDPDTGEVTEVRCTYDPETRGGDSADGRKVKGTIHWVSASHAVEAPLRLYDHLFTALHPDKPEEGVDWKSAINPESLVTVTAMLEPSLKDARVGDTFQFERSGYFIVDQDSTPGAPIFNRTVALRDSWAKIEKKS
jgi:glutaminyl-tRNA synthetase